MMNYRFGAVLALAAILAAWSQAPAVQQNASLLFNGQDLANFQVVLANRNADPSRTFIPNNGLLRITGQPFGFIYTARTYRNFALRYDWRYVPTGVGPEDTRLASGVLLRIQNPARGTAAGIWPQCIQVQGSNREPAKLVGIGDADINNIADDNEARQRALRPLGQWNTTEVVANEGRIVTRLNGVPIGSCITNLRTGPIGIQSEGAAIDYQNIVIVEL
jgi:hypothetical protein